MLTLFHDGKEYSRLSAEELLAAGVPAGVVAAAQAEARLNAAKQECRRRIYSVASAETQMNMASVAAVIGAKTASARNADEKAQLAGIEAAIGWVALMRTNLHQIASDPNANIYDDADWPDCPPEAVAVAEAF